VPHGDPIDQLYVGLGDSPLLSLLRSIKLRQKRNNPVWQFPWQAIFCAKPLTDRRLHSEETQGRVPSVIFVEFSEAEPRPIVRHFAWPSPHLPIGKWVGSQMFREL
jgi:hypothetical protein